MKIIRNLPVVPLPCKSSNMYHHDVIAYIGMCFITMVFTKEDKLVIKFLRETKRYGAKRFLPEFPVKPC